LGDLVNAPAHIPADRIRDVNIYALPGQEADFHAAWKALQDSSPDLIWTPQNEGHWIAMRGDVLAEVQSDHERFSSSVIVLPKSVGEQHKLIPTTGLTGCCSTHSLRLRQSGDCRSICVAPPPS
jgi:camphor 5-monooxygenase